ncbi:hypothetical protein L2E82_28181 [Cichorium intybus]|uniref:Uncharacterized protein n=1 Tax=Cichorium intybus TaxID=13427 RepID=A0ACB9CVD1_CICIN|nr:hypothetical protein L2E82_28181 [Cichorium intybus]
MFVLPGIDRSFPRILRLLLYAWDRRLRSCEGGGRPSVAVCNSGFREKLLSVGFHQRLIVGLVMTGGENRCAKVVYPSCSVGEALYRRFVYTNSWRKRSYRRNPENHLLYQLLLKLQLHILHNVLFRSLLEIETLNAKGSLQMDTSSLDFIISIGTSQDFPGDKLSEEFSQVLKPDNILQPLLLLFTFECVCVLAYMQYEFEIPSTVGDEGDGDGFNCGGCRTLLMYTCGARSVRFSCCVTVNLAPVSNHLAHVNCGYCRTMLMYPFGAALVKCVLCHYITNANEVQHLRSIVFDLHVACSVQHVCILSDDSPTLVETLEKWIAETKLSAMRPNTMNNYGVVLDDFGRLH